MQSRSSWDANSNTLYNKNNHKNHDTTHATVTNSTISSKTNHEQDFYPINDQNSLNEINYPIYIDTVVHYDKEQVNFPRNDQIGPITVRKILSFMAKSLEILYNLPLVNIQSYHFKVTAKRNKRSNNFYSTYNLTIQPSNQ